MRQHVVAKVGLVLMLVLALALCATEVSGSSHVMTDVLDYNPPETPTGCNNECFWMKADGHSSCATDAAPKLAQCVRVLANVVTNRLLQVDVDANKGRLWCAQEYMGAAELSCTGEKEMLAYPATSVDIYSLCHGQRDASGRTLFKTPIWYGTSTTATAVFATMDQRVGAYVANTGWLAVPVVPFGAPYWDCKVRNYALVDGGQDCKSPNITLIGAPCGQTSQPTPVGVSLYDTSFPYTESLVSNRAWNALPVRIPGASSITWSFDLPLWSSGYSDAHFTPAEVDRANQPVLVDSKYISYFPESAFLNNLYPYDGTNYMIGKTDCGQITGLRKLWTPLKVSFPFSYNVCFAAMPTGVPCTTPKYEYDGSAKQNLTTWCDAPRDATSRTCTAGIVDLKKEVYVPPASRARGCIGYGRCPVAINNGGACNTVNKGGMCMTNAKCKCNGTLDDGALWGGLACDKPITSAIADGGAFSCEDFNPCSETGSCWDDENGQAQCTCWEAWMGLPGDLSSRSIYSAAFFGDTDTCINITDASAASLDNYIRTHQCLFFAGTAGVLKRYLIETTNMWENPGNFTASVYSVPQPLWYSGPNDAYIKFPYTGSIFLDVQQVVKKGYNCADLRVTQIRDQENLLFGGTDCLQCPLCDTSVSECVDAPGSGVIANHDHTIAQLVDTKPCNQRMCACAANWWHNDTSSCKNAVCDKQICPWLTNHTVPCGGPQQGQCEFYPNDPLRNTPINSTWLGSCTCYDGWTGVGCQTQACPKDDKGKICGGTSTHGAAPGQSYGQGSALNRAYGCIENAAAANLSAAPGFVGVCHCLENQISGDSYTCELPACVQNARGECNGLTKFGVDVGSHAPSYNSICNRALTPPVCECWLARDPSEDSVSAYDAQPLVSFWGSMCDQTFNTSSACQNPGDSSLCTGQRGVCLIPAFARTRYAGQAAECICGRLYAGQYCEASKCTPDATNSLRVCSGPLHPAGTKAAGVCQGWLVGSDGAEIRNDDLAQYYKCGCNTLDTNNNYDPDLCVNNVSPRPGCAVFGGPQCEQNWQACTTWSGTAYQVCSGNGVCQRVGADFTTNTSFVCQCFKGYNGTNCSVSLECGGTCDASGTVRCVNGACQCDPYHSGSACGTLVCNGNYSATPTKRCDCTYYNGGRSSFVNGVGCVKTCPAYNGLECGGLDKNGNSRCNGTGDNILVASSQVVQCDCTEDGPDVNTASASFIKWANSSNGACEPYCKNGGTWDSGLSACSCTSQFNGTRCDNRRCFNSGQWGVPQGTSSGSVCCCNERCDAGPTAIDFPFTSASFCQVSACLPNGTSQVGDDWCSVCYPPFQVSNDPKHKLCLDTCAPGGYGNATSGTCICDDFHWGPFCKDSFCHDGKPSSNKFCNCNAGYYWDGQDCMPAFCSNDGTLPNNGTYQDKGTITYNCTCPVTWGGTDCTIDLCRYQNATAYEDTTTHVWSCRCNPGYSKDTSGSAIGCTKNLCNNGIIQGTPVPCFAPSGTPRCAITGISYNCLCPAGSIFVSVSTGVGTCSALACGAHGHAVSADGTGVPSCECDPCWDHGTNGVVTTSCSVYECTTGQVCAINVTGGICLDVLPTDCGPGSNGVSATGKYCTCLPGYTPDGTGLRCISSCIQGPGLYKALLDGCECALNWGADDTGNCTIAYKVVPAPNAANTTDNIFDVPLPCTDTRTGLATGAIIGIAIGTAAAGMVAGIVLYRMLWKRKKRIDSAAPTTGAKVGYGAPGDPPWKPRRFVPNV